MATLATFRTNLRLDLGDGATNYTNGEIDRAVQRAVRDLSRYVPYERVLDHTFVHEITAEAWTSASAAGTYVTLGNQWIQPGSEVVKLGSTTYARDTDYTIDYARGRITHISGGSLSDSTAYTVDYTKHKIIVDMSGVADFQKVVAIEYPAGQVPESRVQWETWNDRLFVKGTMGGEAQQVTGEKQHIWIYYFLEHTAPTASAAGTYPLELDEIVTKGAQAYLYRMRAGEQQLQVTTDLNLSRDNIVSSNLDIVSATADLALAKAEITSANAEIVLSDAEVVLADAELVLSSAEVVLADDNLILSNQEVVRADIELTLATKEIVLADAQTALSSAEIVLSAAELVLSVAEITNSPGVKSEILLANTQVDNAVATLAKIDSIQTDADTALDKVNGEQTTVDTLLDKVEAMVNGARTSSEAVLDSIVNADLPNVGAALSKIESYLSSKSESAAALLTTAASAAVLGEVNVELDASEVDFAAAITTLSSIDKHLESAGSAEEDMDNVDSLTTAGEPLKDADVALDAVITSITTDAEADLNSAEGVWANQVQHILTQAGIPNAEDLIELGDGFINTINDGENVAERYRMYAESALSMADQWGDKRKDFLRQGEIHVAMAGAQLREAELRQNQAAIKVNIANTRIGIARAFLGEAAEHARSGQGRLAIASQRVAEVGTHINLAQGYLAVSTGFEREAAQWIAYIQTKLGISRSYLETANGLISEVNARFGAIDRRLGETDFRLALIDRRLAEAAGEVATADAYNRNAQGYIANAQVYLNSAAGYSATAAGYRATADAYLVSAAGYRSNADGYAASAIRYRSNAEGYLVSADRYRANAEGYLTSASRYRSNAEGYLTSSVRHRSNAEGHLVSSNRHEASAEGYRDASAQSIALSVEYSAKANELRDEFYAVLRDRSTYARRMFGAAPN